MSKGWFQLQRATRDRLLDVVQFQALARMLQKYGSRQSAKVM